MYVTPILEYAAVVWAPLTRCDIERQEAVQRQDLSCLIIIVLVVSL